jgi:plastocyanin
MRLPPARREPATVQVLLVVLLAALLAGCSSSGGQGDATGGQAPAKGATTVVARQNRFAPVATEVPAGTEVTWTFDDGNVPHDVKGDGWSSGKPRTSGTFGHTFDRPGTYDYVCTLHSQMTGRVVVTARP